MKISGELGIRKPIWKRLLIGVGGVALVLVLGHCSGLFDVVLRQNDIDIYSGRERERVEVFGVPVFTSERDTPFSQLVARSAHASSPPEWRRFLTRGGAARINYHYGQIVSEIRSTLSAAELLEVPPGKLAEAGPQMLLCLKLGDDFSLHYNERKLWLTKFSGGIEETIFEYEAAGR